MSNADSRTSPGTFPSVSTIRSTSKYRSSVHWLNSPMPLKFTGVVRQAMFCTGASGCVPMYISASEPPTQYPSRFSSSSPESSSTRSTQSGMRESA